MARKTKAVVIQADGRDKGKAFWITEKPPIPVEKWGQRALLAIGRSGKHQMPENWENAGIAGLLTIGVQALTSLNFADAEPLMDEMLECVEFVPDATKTDAITKHPITRPVMWDVDVEEVSTLLALRSEVIELHTGFSIAAFLSTLGERAKAAMAKSGSDT